MKNTQISLSFSLSLSLTQTHTQRHATSSVTGLFSPPVFRVYSWSCVCACDPGRCSRSNVRLPLRLGERMCAHVCGSHSLCVRHTQPYPQWRGLVFTFGCVLLWAITHFLSLLSFPFTSPLPAQYYHHSFFPSPSLLLSFISPSQHLLSFTPPALFALWLTPHTHSRIMKDKH